MEKKLDRKPSIDDSSTVQQRNASKQSLDRRTKIVPSEQFQHSFPLLPERTMLLLYFLCAIHNTKQAKRLCFVGLFVVSQSKRGKILVKR